MPIGLAKFAYQGYQVATPSLASEAVFSLSTLDIQFQNYQHLQIEYAGDDSSGQSVYFVSSKDSSNNFVCGLIRRNNDDTITESSKTTLKSVGSDTHYSCIGCVGYDTSSNLVGVTVASYASGGTQDVVMYKNSIDLDNLTLGTTYSSGAFDALTPTAGFTMATYVGNGRFIGGYRNSGIRPELLVVNSTSITTGNEGYVGFGDGVWQQVVGFNYQADNYYRFAGANGNGNDTGAGHFYTTTAGSSVTDTDISVGLTKTYIHCLNTTNLMLGVAGKSASAQAQAISITWPTGGSTSAPTLSKGSVLTLTDSANFAGSPASATDRTNNKGYIVYKSSTGWKFTNLSVSGTTLTEGTPVSVGVTTTNWHAGYLTACFAPSTQGNLFVGLFDDTGSSYPQIYFKDVDA